MSKAFVPYYIKTPTLAYTSKVSSLVGGYELIDNLCIVNIKITTTATHDPTTWILYGLPNAKIKTSYSHGKIYQYANFISDADGSEVRCALADHGENNMGIAFSTGSTLPSGTYYLSLSYLT